MVIEQQDSVDVLVVGGGTAGTVAAIQAARAGATTAVIEMRGLLGGTMTWGGVKQPGYFHAWGRQVVAGIGWELVAATLELDGRAMPDFGNPPVGRPSHYVQINAALYPVVAEEAACAVGVRLHYHETVVEVQPAPEGWVVTSIGKGIRRTTTCRELIDCSGDADVVGMLGFEREEGEVRQPGTLEFMLSGYDAKALDPAAVQRRYEAACADGRLKAGDFAGMNSRSFMAFLQARGWNQQHILGADSTTADSQTVANVAGRQSLLRLLRFVKTLPGCGGTRVEWVRHDTAIRETYRIVGETAVTREDYLSGRLFPDAIGYTIFFVDLHTEAGGETEFLAEGIVPTIPFGALVPRGSQRLLAAGRCIASDRLANSALRVQPSCMVMGQAAGAAAALAVQLGCPSRDVPLGQLRALLADHGAVLPVPCIPGSQD
ncbi:MAG: FAD-dependent oxidoreductase [Victivallales bacterium]|jgi:hypothetical protein|nr:FAD-dependent oxidoreductase [Victivallales bacterium]MBT7162104.1 FAD-dependent oxidoreductase [Victivallales bacterium]